MMRLENDGALLWLKIIAYRVLVVRDTLNVRRRGLDKGFCWTAEVLLNFDYEKSPVSPHARTRRLHFYSLAAEFRMESVRLGFGPTSNACAHRV